MLSAARSPALAGSLRRGAAAAVQGRRLAGTQTGGPGLPGQGEMKDEQMDKQIYQGDKVEDAPKPKTFKPQQEEPSAEFMDRGKGSERVQTPASPGRPQDSSEPIGGPM